MLWVNCKDELKPKCTKHCVIPGAHNADANSNNIFFTIKETKLYVPVVTISAKDNLELSKLLSNGLERLVCWNGYKTKRERKNTITEFRSFLNSGFAGVKRFFVLVYLNQNNDVKRYKVRSYCLQNSSIKNYDVTINGKYFCDQPIDFLI